jgi:uncharacterized membrane protein (Fun14 family)
MRVERVGYSDDDKYGKSIIADVPSIVLSHTYKNRDVHDHLAGGTTVITSKDMYVDNLYVNNIVGRNIAKVNVVGKLAEGEIDAGGEFVRGLVEDGAMEIFKKVVLAVIEVYATGAFVIMDNGEVSDETVDTITERVVNDVNAKKVAE